ncbi:MAG: glycogen/starch/alpha-glucan phosphorylase, partial [Clostridia bacterium]|nr:glycogen/starch/alpha-glucan phosphorylase [Clostridia bacterium]
MTAKTVKTKPEQTKKEDRVSAETLRKLIDAKLLSRGIGTPEEATDEQLYRAVVAVVKDIMNKDRTDFKKRIKTAKSKKVCYLCMEFLVGRSLEKNVSNLGLRSALDKVLADYGRDFSAIFACETDPGLGNGGLGRLAACFMDSLSALDYSASGYSLLYENGLFRQKLVDGEQVEIPDQWIEHGGAWLIARPEKSMSVRFGGQISENWENGQLKITNTEYDEVRAVAYDLMIPGTTTNAVNTLRLWKAKEAAVPTLGFSTQGTYVKSLEETSRAEEITKQLYPPDNHDEGKLLRLTQQYFLVSASLQSIFSDYYASYGSLECFSDRIAIHINDTHPALCIPELMRILMDVYSYSWEDAWDTVVKTVTYTNHTVMPEALECWRVDLFRLKLPRIYMIVEEINRRFCADLWKLYPGDWDRISRMAVVGYGQVRMANL